MTQRFLNALGFALVLAGAVGALALGEHLASAPVAAALAAR